MKAFVPDTNAWLHATLPIDFPTMADGEEFVVVIPHRVLWELDRHQHEGRGAIRKRARTVLMDIHSMINAGLTTPGGIEAASPGGIPHRLVVDANARPEASADDIIVATAAGLRAEGLTPILVTADAAMQMSAQLAGVELQMLDADQLEPDQSDSLEQDVATLKRQLRELQNPQPMAVEVLAQPLWPRGSPPELVRLKLPSTELLDELRERVAEGMFASESPLRLDEDGRQAYNAALPEYARRLADHLGERAHWEAAIEAAVQVQVLIVNRTPHPVTDAVLELTAPASTSFEYPPAEPEAPDAPPRPAALFESPLAGLESRIASLSNFATMLPAALRDISVRVPRVRTEGRRAEMRPAEPLRPDHRAFAGRIWISVAPEFEGDEIVISYTLYAAAAGKPTSGQMTIPITSRPEVWKTPTLPTYAAPKLAPSSRVDQRMRQEMFEELGQDPWADTQTNGA
jgi:hypothetical protein